MQRLWGDSDAFPGVRVILIPSKKYEVDMKVGIASGREDLYPYSYSLMELWVALKELSLPISISAEY